MGSPSFVFETSTDQRDDFVVTRNHGQLDEPEGKRDMTAVRGIDRPDRDMAIHGNHPDQGMAKSKSEVTPSAATTSSNPRGLRWPTVALCLGMTAILAMTATVLVVVLKSPRPIRGSVHGPSNTSMSIEVDGDRTTWPKPAMPDDHDEVEASPPPRRVPAPPGKRRQPSRPPDASRTPNAPPAPSQGP